MAGPIPIIRQLVVCDQVSFSFDTGYTLVNPRVDLVGQPGDAFPLRWPELWVFAQVTGSYGRHHFRLRIHDVTDPTAPPDLVFEDRLRTTDFGSALGRHRLRSRGWSVKLTDAVFLTPGRYELSMTFDGGPPTDVELFVEEHS